MINKHKTFDLIFALTLMQNIEKIFYLFYLTNYKQLANILYGTLVDLMYFELYKEFCVMIP